MQGLLASGLAIRLSDNGVDADQVGPLIADAAYGMADHMLIARETKR
jgi:hypothetical protein